MLILLERMCVCMIAITQCLDFLDDKHIKEICDFYLILLKNKNKDVYEHSCQVANYATSTAAKLGLSASEVSRIKTAALLHDIGQLAVPNLVLRKWPYLSTRETTLYKRHCDAGYSMLENIPGFEYIIEMIRYHHEHWDGTGYPKRLKGANIPLGARIIAVCNFYDRHINPCSAFYEKSHEVSVQELLDKSGMDFDPVVVKAFLDAVVASEIEEGHQAQA